MVTLGLRNGVGVIEGGDLDLRFLHAVQLFFMPPESALAALYFLSFVSEPKPNLGAALKSALVVS